MTILALDPSTEVTGAVCNTYCNQTGCLLACEKFAFDAYAAVPKEWRGTTLDARRYRIFKTSEALAQWIETIEVDVDLIAYEMDTQRGFASSEALKMAAGNYITLPGIVFVPSVGVSRQQACLATNTYQVYRQPKGKTKPEQDAKRLRLKQAVLAAINRMYDMALTSDEDAVADACAVAEYAMQSELKKQKDEAEKAAQKAMFAQKVAKAGARSKKVQST